MAPPIKVGPEILTQIAAELESLVPGISAGAHDHGSHYGTEVLYEELDSPMPGTEAPLTIAALSLCAQCARMTAFASTRSCHRHGMLIVAWDPRLHPRPPVPNGPICGVQTCYVTISAWRSTDHAVNFTALSAPLMGFFFLFVAPFSQARRRSAKNRSTYRPRTSTSGSMPTVVRWDRNRRRAR